MLKASTLDFLSQLAANNHRDWFAANKVAYEQAKKDFEANVQDIIDGIGSFEPDLKGLDAKKSVFRIYRDVRFSKDKSPYKINLGAGFGKDGKGMASAGYYMHIQPGGHSMLGGGMYMPDNATLASIRQEIDYNTGEFEAILNKKDFKQHFGGLEDMKLKTTPKNYAKDHPHIELLKYTSYVAMQPLTDKEVTSKDFVENSVAAFKALKPLLDFLNRVKA